MTTDLPPEAFTKQTLQEAFNWLQDQPEVVKASVHTPERLVSLFRKAQRNPNQEAPVSSKRFIEDLKSLTGHLNEFNDSTRPSSSATNKETTTAMPLTDLPPPPHNNDHKDIETYTRPSQDRESAVSSRPPAGSTQTTETETETRQASLQFTHQRQRTTQVTTELDELSMKRVHQVRERFNLTSDREALRLLISLGFEKFDQFQ